MLVGEEPHCTVVLAAAMVTHVTVICPGVPLSDVRIC